MQRVAIIRFPGSNCDEDTLRAAASAGSSHDGGLYTLIRRTSPSAFDSIVKVSPNVSGVAAPACGCCVPTTPAAASSAATTVTHARVNMSRVRVR